MYLDIHRYCTGILRAAMMYVKIHRYSTRKHEIHPYCTKAKIRKVVMKFGRKTLCMPKVSNMILTQFWPKSEIHRYCTGESICLNLYSLQMSVLKVRYRTILIWFVRIVGYSLQTHLNTDYVHVHQRKSKGNIFGTKWLIIWEFKSQLCFLICLMTI